MRQQAQERIIHTVGLCKYLRVAFAFSQCACRQVTLYFCLNAADKGQHYCRDHDEPGRFSPDEYRRWQTLARKLIKHHYFEPGISDFVEFVQMEVKNGSVYPDGSKRKSSKTNVSLAPAEENDKKSRRKWSLLPQQPATPPSIEDSDEAMADVATDWTIDQAMEAQMTVQKWIENVGDKNNGLNLRKLRQLFASTPTSVLKHMDLSNIRSELSATSRMHKKRSMALLTTYQRYVIGIIEFLSELSSEEEAPDVNELQLKSEPSDLQL